MTRTTFSSWLDLKHYAETHAWMYYQAPMDRHPVAAAVCRVFKNGKVRLDYHGHRWTIDEGHLSRCSRNL
jgi:hypothetical protein